MGSGQSISGMCCAPAKSQHVSRKKSQQGNCHGSSSSENSPQSPGIAEVWLTREDFEDGNLEELNRRQPNIQHVRLAMCDGRQWILTDEDLGKLNALTQVKSFDLSGCRQITRRGLEYLSLCPDQIQVLILNDCTKITDTFFDDIVHFSHLEHLEVRGCFHITDKGVEALAGVKCLRHLKHLDISVHATAEMMTSEASCGDKTVTDRSMQALSGMNQLETLVMEGCLHVTDKGIVRLVTLRKLTKLCLSGTGLTDQGLMILKYLPELQTLHVANCQILESVTLRHQLSAAPTITHLNMARVPGVTDELIRGLVQPLDLKHLDVSGCKQLSDNCMQEINNFSSLTYLNANDCPGISGASLDHLSSLSGLTFLHMNKAVDIDYHHLLKLSALEILEIGARISEEEQLHKLARDLKRLNDITVHISTAGSDRCMNMSGKRILVKHADTMVHQE